MLYPNFSVSPVLPSSHPLTDVHRRQAAENICDLTRRDKLH